MAGPRTAVPADDARLAFAGHGAGPPLLSVHGVMISGELFEPVLARLAARHRVIVPDLRGHGRSRHLPPPYTVEAMAADLATLLDDLGIGAADVLGHSQAAPSRSSSCSTARPPPAAGTCLHHAFNMATVRERLEGQVARWLIRLPGMPRFARLVNALGLKQVTPERAPCVVGLIADKDPRLTVAAWRAAMAFDSRGRLGEIACPTLVIAGADDTAGPHAPRPAAARGHPGRAARGRAGRRSSADLGTTGALRERVEAFLTEATTG